jgi:hypothetical protein
MEINRPFSVRAALAGLAGVCAVGAAQIAAAQSTAPGMAAQQSAASAPPATQSDKLVTGSSERSEVSFRQLGARESLNFWRTGTSIGVPFSVRGDEVITAAKLRLVYTLSQTLVARQSAQLKVALNGEPVAAVALTRDQVGANVTQEIAVDPRLISDFNRLSLQLDNTSPECVEAGKGDPLARISNASLFELQAMRLGLANDLALLPLPFFDVRDPRKLELPFVFAEKPAASTLEAASIAASWFGWQAGYRGAAFTAHLNRMPRGNAIVFATATEQPAGLGVPSANGPSLAVVTNPTDEQGKLLVVMGRDARELKSAATALALGAGRVAGQMAQVSPPSTVRPRAAYDTANWVPTNRPVRLGEFADVRRLNVSGQDPDPVRVNLRIPPDIFAWRTDGIPIDLKYRYVPKTIADMPLLNVNVNGGFVQSIPLRSDTQTSGWRSWFRVDERRAPETTLADGTLPGRTMVHVPPGAVAAQSHFNMEYDFDYAGRLTCRQVLDTRIGGGIDPDSTIDLSGLPHFLPMPNLAAFSNAGYPFTRVADLSETAIVLSDSPTASEISAMLTMVGRMGDSTGFPGTSVAVVRASDAGSMAGKDLLLIGSPGSHGLMKQWSRQLTWDTPADSIFGRIQLPQWWERFVLWLKTQGSAQRVPRADEGTSTARRQAGDAVLVGFESPMQPGRSVVAMVGGREDSLGHMVNALIDPTRVSRVQGSAVAIGPDYVEPLSMATSYYVGDLPLLTRIHWYFSKHPIRLWVTALVAIILLALLLHRFLSGIAGRRLRV